MYDEPHQIRWLYNLELPFYFALVYLKNNPRIDIYSTAERIPYYYYVDNIDLIRSINFITPLHQNHEYPKYDNGNIFLGKPIITIPISEYGKRDETLYQSFNEWITTELDNLNWFKHYTKIFFRLNKYQTNMMPPEKEGVTFYSKTGTVSKEMAHRYALSLENMFCHLFPKPETEPLEEERKRLLFSFCQQFKMLSPNIIQNIKQRFPIAIKEWEEAL